MLNVTKKVFSILSKKQKVFSVFLLFMMILGGAMESLGVSLILPLVTVITDSEGWADSWYASLLCAVFKIDNQRKYISVLLILLIIVFFVKNIYLMFEYFTQYTFTAKVRYKLQYNLMRSYMGRKYVFFLNASSGEIIRNITIDTNQVFQLMSALMTFYTELVICAILAATLVAISPVIAVGLVIILGIELLFIYKIIKPIMKSTGDTNRSCMANANKWVLQGINGIKSIKIAGTQSFFADSYDKYSKKSVNAERKYSTLIMMPKLIIESFTVAGVLVIILVLFLNGGDLNQLMPQLSAFVMASVKLLPSANKISSSTNSVSFYEGGLDKVIAAIYSEENCDDKNNEIQANMTDEGKSADEDGCFGLKNVTFSYPNTDSRVLADATITIHRGESVGIIGQSGGGKTTTMDIMLGLLEPQEGYAHMNGRDIRVCRNEWLSKVAYIPQQIFLMDASIKDNIIFGRSDIPYDKKIIEDVLRDAKLDEFVNGLKDGVDTEVGEQGIRLSGGQRQRIGIARALYGNPDILFFDEATSALDNETESDIMESINSLKGKKTMVIIAHRLTTIENCDVVYRVENGKIEKA